MGFNKVTIHLDVRLWSDLQQVYTYRQNREAEGTKRSLE